VDVLYLTPRILFRSRYIGMSNTDLTFTVKNLLTVEFPLPFRLFRLLVRKFKLMHLNPFLLFVYVFHCGRRPVDASSMKLCMLNANVSGSKF